MRNSHLLRKGLTVAVILLFVGVAVAPSINFSVVKAASDNELIEVTSEACGIKGYGNTTVKLTIRQYHEVEQLFDELNIQLDKAKTREDVVTIYHNAIIGLNKYGLLPKGMTIELAQRLVTGRYQHSITDNPLLTKLIHKRGLGDYYSNAFCFVFARGGSWFGGSVLIPIWINLLIALMISLFIPLKYIAEIITMIIAIIGLSWPISFMGLGLWIASDFITKSFGLKGYVVDDALFNRTLAQYMIGFSGLRIQLIGGHSTFGFILGHSLAVTKLYKYR
jgi:hypothetical protein